MSNDKTNPSIWAVSKVLSHLLYAGRFCVPWHQRYYDWRQEHVKELLDDINEAVDEKRTCYFLGAVMLVEKEDEVWEINDGQQRMVTFSLICAALCRLFCDRGDALRENRALRNLFVLDQNNTKKLADADELKPRFSPPRNDKARYNLLIRQKNIGTNGKLTAAWQVIEGFFRGMGEEKARHFFDFLIQKIEVAALYIPTGVDPNSVYETLNCRGKRLDDLDMLRNHLYSYFNSDQEESRRNTVHDNLEGVRLILKEEQKSAEYARCFFQCKFGFLPKDRLYRAAKRQIKGEIEKHPRHRSAKGEADYVYKLVEEFCVKDRVEIFRTIASPGEHDSLIQRFNSDLPKKPAAPKGIFLSLRELQAYKVAQPIVFALLNCYARETDGRKRKSLAHAIMYRMKLLTAFVMRTAFSVPKFETSHFESEFSDLAQKILSANSLGGIDFARCLKECDENGVTDDKKFVDTLSRVQMRNSTKAKRFLLGLAYFERPADLIISEHRCSVEHILPKSKAHLADWGKFDVDQHSDSVHMLGNLTLLGDQENKPGIANLNFSRKKEIYKKSGISLTKDIVDKYDDWSPDNIVERQKRMAKIAARVWPFAA